MNLFSRLAVGTAAWGKLYNGVRVSDDDQRRILEYAMASGIDMIDTATAYGVDWTRWNSYFKRVIKINKDDSLVRIKEIIDSQPYCVMAHDDQALRHLGDFLRYTPIKKGISIYEHFRGYIERAISVVQCPYSLFDRRFAREFEALSHVEVHVRSVFLRGKILEDGISPEECLKFVLANPYVDRIIIGSDTFEQFRQNVHFIHEWQRLEKHDLALLDPRQSKEQK